MRNYVLMMMLVAGVCFAGQAGAQSKERATKDKTLDTTLSKPEKVYKEPPPPKEPKGPGTVSTTDKGISVDVSKSGETKVFAAPLDKKPEHMMSEEERRRTQGGGGAQIGVSTTY